MKKKIKLLCDTFASGKPLKAGRNATVSQGDAAILIRMGKALPLEVKEDPPDNREKNDPPDDDEE
jgi:hypothetical protein